MSQNSHMKLGPISPSVVTLQTFFWSKFDQMRNCLAISKMQISKIWRKLATLGEIDMKGGKRAALSRMWVVQKIVTKIQEFYLTEYIFTVLVPLSYRS